MDTEKIIENILNWYYEFYGIEPNDEDKIFLLNLLKNMKEGN
jgi:hypothetical protein